MKIIIVLGIIVLFILLFIGSLQFSKAHYSMDNLIKHGVKKRIHPYPYRCSLAICSDIDRTNTLSEFLSIQEFLNTDNKTNIGPGVNLEIGNSFFPIANRGLFALLSQNPHDKEVIIELIKIGYIDFIHSFNTAKNRSEILKIINTLKMNNCKIDVWVNHARALSDVGSKSWCLGDDPSSEHYHTDVSIGDEDGYKFVWTGAVSSILGQGVPLTLRSFFLALDKSHLIQSIYNSVIKELGKYLLSFVGDEYAYRKNNELIYPVKLDDGNLVYGFVRSNISYRGIRKGSQSDGLADILRENFLEILSEEEGFMVIYTHFGQNNGPPYLDSRSAKGLKLLAAEYHKGNIFVTTTSRLLKYYANNKHLQWRVEKNRSGIEIHIDQISDPIRGNFIPDIIDLQGISFETENIYNTRIFLDGKAISSFKRIRKPNEHSGVVMFPFESLPEVNKLFSRYKKNGYF